MLSTYLKSPADIRGPFRCLLITGFIDTTCVPSSVYAAYNLIPADAKRIVNFPQAIHGTYPEFNLVTEEFLDELLKEQP